MTLPAAGGASESAAVRPGRSGSGRPCHHVMMMMIIGLRVRRLSPSQSAAPGTVAQAAVTVTVRDSVSHSPGRRRTGINTPAARKHVYTPTRRSPTEPAVAPSRAGAEPTLMIILIFYGVY